MGREWEGKERWGEEIGEWRSGRDRGVEEWRGGRRVEDRRGWGSGDRVEMGGGSGEGVEGGGG